MVACSPFPVWTPIEREASPAVAGLDLRKIFEGLDRAFAESGIHDVRDPATSETIAAAAAGLPFALPPDLVRVYSWHDGVTPFLPRYDLLPVAEAVKDYREILAVEDAEGFQNWPRSVLPALKLDGVEYLGVDCSTPEGRIVLASAEYGPAQQRYGSIKHLLAVTLEAYRNGGYRVREGWLDANPLRVREAEDEYAAAHVLGLEEKRWQSIARFAKGWSWRLRGRSGALGIVTRLRDSRDPRALPFLRRYLQADDPHLVAFSASALGFYRQKEDLERVVPLLTHSSATVRNFAARAVGDLAADEVDGVETSLLPLLADPDVLVRMSAVQALGRTRERGILPDLVHIMENDDSRAVRLEAILALGLLKDRRAIEPLRRLRAWVANVEDDARTYGGIRIDGGVRGSEPAPAALRYWIDETLKKLESLE